MMIMSLVDMVIMEITGSVMDLETIYMITITILLVDMEWEMVTMGPMGITTDGISIVQSIKVRIVF